jgi:hypothetical protein
MNKLMTVMTAALLTVLAAKVVRAQDAASQSTKPWVALTHIQTTNDFAALPDNATIAMSCPKCKSVTTIIKENVTTKPGHGTIEAALQVDQCPGCGGKMTTELKQTKMVHTCSMCGAGAFCCATTPGKPTSGMQGMPGMEEKK